MVKISIEGAKLVYVKTETEPEEEKDGADVIYKTQVVPRVKLYSAIVVGIVALLVCIVVVVGVVVKKGDSPSVLECSGNGLKHVDSPDLCVCWPCRKGADCSEAVEDCFVDLSSGQPLLLQEYWRDHRESTTRLPPDFKTLYGSAVPSLLDSIRQLHALVGNANTTGKEIVLGYGGTNVIIAALWAIQYFRDTPLTIFAEPPHYTYGGFTGFNPVTGTFNDSLFQNESQIIEIVTTPNNPTCKIRYPYFQNPAYRIYDMVYYWPSYVAIERMYDADIMIFSASKCTGHAGNRLGWALVKDPLLAQRMNMYITATTFGYSPDLQQKFSLIFQHVVATEGQAFQFVKQTLKGRYERLMEILDAQPEPKRFSLESKVGGFYLWLKCNWPEDQDACLAVFQHAGVNGRPGSVYGYSDDHVRFNFMLHQSEADVLFDYVQALCHANRTQSHTLRRAMLPYDTLGC